MRVRLREALPRLNDQLYRACVWVSGVALVAMSLIIPWGIFTRYVLGTGSQWPEPVAIQLMVLFTFLGAAAACRAGAHIAVAMVTDRVALGARRAMAFGVRLLMAGVAAFMVFHGAKLCLATLGQVVGQLPWLPVGITYLPVPIGGAVTLLFVVEEMCCGSAALRPAVAVEAQG